MTQGEASHLIQKSMRFKLSSMNYLDAKAPGSFSIVRDDDTALIIQSGCNERMLVHRAVKGVHDLISTVRVLAKTGISKEATEIESVPEACVEAFEQIGFSTLREWADYWKTPIDAIGIDVPKGLVARRATKDEYARAAEITQACRGLSR